MKPLTIISLTVVLCFGCAAKNEETTAQRPSTRPTASSGQTRASDSPAPARKEQEPRQFADVASALTVLSTGIAADDHVAIRAATIWLARQGASAVESLDREVKNPKNELRYRLACLNVLGYLGPPAAPSILAATEAEPHQLRVKAVEMLGNLHPADEATIRRLIMLLDAEEEGLRRAAIQSLGRIGRPAQAAAPRLQAILNSGASESLRGAAGQALTRIDPRVGFGED